MITTTSPRPRPGRLARLRAVGLVVVTLALGSVLVAPNAGATPGTSRLEVGEQLQPGQYLSSPSGLLTLIMQGDGNLVLYAPGNQARWSSRTDGHPGAWAQFNGDGNFVVYGPGAVPLWNAFDDGGLPGGSFLQIQDDGNLVQYTSTLGVTWYSGTFYFPSSIDAPGTLLPGQSLQSPNGQYRLTLQGDGNLVLYDVNDQWIWHTNTQGTAVNQLAIQADGNLVLYTPSGYVWQAGSYGNQGGRFQVQDDGNVVYYSAAWTPLWHSFGATNIVKRDGTGAGGTADMTGRQAAGALLASGRLTGTAEAVGQIRAVSNGTVLTHVINGATRACNLDPAILRALKTLVVDQGSSVTVSSFNRYCTGTVVGAGVSSYHYRNGGGHAVDLGAIDGAANAGDARMIAFAQRFVNVVDKPAGIGQKQCRPAGSVSIPAGVIQFDDTCNHLHLEYRG